jgi:hypothetical protein
MNQSNQKAPGKSMHDIQCPNCGKAFKIDESSYADILKQVRDRAFEQQLNERLALAAKEKEVAIELARAHLSNQLQSDLGSKQQQIDNLKAQIDRIRLEQQLAVAQTVSSIERERDNLQRDLSAAASQRHVAEQNLKERYEQQLKDREDQIERLRDMKAKLSTKMVGETLEQHCQIEFEKIRAAAFPLASFGKDNDASTGSKGDFIFREGDPDGTEFVSIMFEMKNESDGTTTRKKNEDFLRELDKDRQEKNCEYAVLVSLLEPDNELYNSGIVDVSHLFQKMYVIRPQFFIPMITLLRNASQKSLQYRTELTSIRAQNLDITKFETQLNDFKDSFGRNYRLASDGFEDAIRRIDDAIKDLERTKDALNKSANNLRIANNKADDLTIKRLTRDNPTMAERFKLLAQGDQAEA